MPRGFGNAAVFRGKRWSWSVRIYRFDSSGPNVVSGSSQAGERRLHHSRMDDYGERKKTKILFHHRAGKTWIDRRKGRLAQCSGNIGKALGHFTGRMMFDLETEIRNWIRNLRSNPGFEDGDIEEIELLDPMPTYQTMLFCNGLLSFWKNKDSGCVRGR